MPTLQLLLELLHLPRVSCVSAHARYRGYTTCSYFDRASRVSIFAERSKAEFMSLGSVFHTLPNSSGRHGMPSQVFSAASMSKLREGCSLAYLRVIEQHASKSQ